MTTMKKFALLTAAIALGTAGQAFATDIEWKNAGTFTNVDWSTGSNWKGGVAPGANDKAQFFVAADVTFVSNIPNGASPKDLTEIEINNASAIVKLAPNSGSPTTTISTLTLSAGQFTVGPSQTLVISSGATISASTTLNVNVGGTLLTNALVTNDGTVLMYGLWTDNNGVDSTGPITIGNGSNAATMNNSADVRNVSGNSAYTVAAGSFMKFQSGADLTRTAGSPSLVFGAAAELQANGGTSDINANYSITDTSSTVYRVTGSAQLNFNAAYSINGDVRLITASASKIGVAAAVTTNGGYCTAWSNKCAGIAILGGSGTFAWSSSLSGCEVGPDSCP